jgi:predicted esterase
MTIRLDLTVPPSYPNPGSISLSLRFSSQLHVICFHYRESFLCEMGDSMMNKSNPLVLEEDRSITAEVKLYYDLRPGHSPSSPLLIALHGYGANKRQMMREALQIAPDGFAIASLQGFHQHLRDPKVKGGPWRFGFGWLTNFRTEESINLHHKALLDLIAELVDNNIADPKRIFLLGFSQSCALNYRFAFTYPDRLRGIVGICGGIPGDWETNERYQATKTAILHLTGTRDEFYPPERVRDYEIHLGTRSPSVASKSYDAPHEIVPDMRRDITQWLLEQIG